MLFRSATSKILERSSCTDGQDGRTTPRSCTAGPKPTLPQRRKEQGTKAPHAGRHLHVVDQALSTNSHQIDESGGTKRQMLHGSARNGLAVMGKKHRPPYSTPSPPPPPCQRRWGALPYYLPASGTDRRPLHPPAATRTAGEGGDRRSGRRRSKGSRRPSFRLSRELFLKRRPPGRGGPHRGAR